MSFKLFSQQSSYEWTGHFWFPEAEDFQFAGKISYSPETGITLSLSTPNAEEMHERGFQARTMMHALVHGENNMCVTLLNVWVSPQITLGNPTIAALSGGAELLIADVWLEKSEVVKMMVEYDDHFNDIFLRPVRKDLDALEYSKSDLIQLSEDKSIQFEFPSSGTFVSSSQDLDSIFLSDSEETLQKIKDAIAPILDEEENRLFLRKQRNFCISFSVADRQFQSVKHLECMWRGFWSLISDHSISIKHIWACIPFEDKNNPQVTQSKKPALCGYYYDAKPQNNSTIFWHRPLNAQSFLQDSFNTQRLEIPLRQWQKIYSEAPYGPILDGVNNALESRCTMISTSQYMSLISEIETFLDIVGQEKKDVDNLIALYASDHWKDEMSKIAVNKRKKETLGQWVTTIRNAIAHPNTYRNLENGRHWKVARDPFQLQKMYAYISGLYIKAVFMFIGGSKEEDIEKYVKKFISVRASYRPMDYK